MATACPSTVRVIVVAFLCYLLLVVTCVPFVTAERSSSGPAAVTPLQEQPLAPHRDGELLVRFRSGLPQPIKDSIIAAQGARRKKQLQGESGVEKLALPAGRNLRTAALELLLDPQVEFAEPNF